jgi:peptidoglycan-associated lipoprotein
MRIRIHHLVFLTLAVAAMMLAGCAKKAPAPPPAPPASTQQTPVPTPQTTPTTETTTPATTSTNATVGDLKTVFFALDSYMLDDAAHAVLDANAKLLRESASLAVRIEGHCDERGTVEYNMSLGQKRAEAVRDYLVGAGVPADRLTTLSYGKERPLVDGHDEAAWSRNRRAEFSRP